MNFETTLLFAVTVETASILSAHTPFTPQIIIANAIKTLNNFSTYQNSSRIKYFNFPIWSSGNK